MYGCRLTADHTFDIVYTRKKAIVDANTESPPIIQHKINIREVRNTSWTAFTPEHNELLVQQVVQDAQGLEGELLYYYILGFEWVCNRG